MDQQLTVPAALESDVLQVDALYTAALQTAVEKARECAFAEASHEDTSCVQLGDAVECELGDFKYIMYQGLQKYITPALLELQHAVKQQWQTDNECMRMGLHALQAALGQANESVGSLMQEVDGLKGKVSILSKDNVQYKQMQGKLKIAQNLITSLKLENLELAQRKTTIPA